MKQTIALVAFLLLCATTSWGKPQTFVNSTTDSFTVTITFAADDDEDSDLIPRGGFCSISAIINGSDVLEIYQVPTATTAAGSGTIIATFTSTTTSPTTLQPAQVGMKARATTSSAGGSKLIIQCSNTQLSAGSGSLDDLSDVDLTAPAPGAVLVKTAGNWVDGKVDLADGDAITGILAAGGISNSIARLADPIFTGLSVASTLPLITLDDNEQTGTVDASISLNCTSGTACTMEFATNSGAESEIVNLAIFTNSGDGVTTVRLGGNVVRQNNPTNYIGVSEGGVLTMEGSATIDGIGVGDLVDRTGAAAILGSWDFSAGTLIAEDDAACTTATQGALCVKAGTDDLFVGGTQLVGGTGGTTSSGGLTQVTNTTDDFAVGYDGAGAAASDYALHFDETTGALTLNVPGSTIALTPHATLGGCFSVSEGTDDGAHTASFCMPDGDTLSGDTTVDAIDSAGKWAAASIGADAIDSANIKDGEIVAADLNATLTFADGAVLDFGTFISSNSEGLMLPSHLTSCAAATAEGQICWEEDAKALWIGDGATAQQMNGAAPSTEIRSMYWGAGAMSADGTNCLDPADTAAIGGAGGPQQYLVDCTLTGNEANGDLFGSTIMPDSWTAASTVTFTVSTVADIEPAAAETFFGNMSAQCVGDGELISTTWGTKVTLDIVWAIADDIWDTTQADSAAVTPAGTCAGGDTLFWYYELCDTDATADTGCTTSPASAIALTKIIGLKMEYSSDIGD